jgi:hypothetical protein
MLHAVFGDELVRDFEAAKAEAFVDEPAHHGFRRQRSMGGV